LKTPAFQPQGHFFQRAVVQGKRIAPCLKAIRSKGGYDYSCFVLIILQSACQGYFAYRLIADDNIGCIPAIVTIVANLLLKAYIKSGQQTKFWTYIYLSKKVMEKPVGR
jgi:hypothetical protein